MALFFGWKLILRCFTQRLLADKDQSQQLINSVFFFLNRIFAKVLQIKYFVIAPSAPP